MCFAQSTKEASSLVAARLMATMMDTVTTRQQSASLLNERNATNVVRQKKAKESNDIILFNAIDCWKDSVCDFWQCFYEKKEHYEHR